MSDNLKYMLFTALTVVLFSIPAHSARRDGLNGNLLIQDHDDVFSYPQRAHSDTNKNRVRLDMEDSTRGIFFSSTGKGAWGLAIGNALENMRAMGVVISRDNTNRCG